uniref:Uncharacterized protein n=1 Tax=Triticum urartu TaxID=4572 RepID=A0A8R7PM14_TRIUA
MVVDGFLNPGSVSVFLLLLQEGQAAAHLLAAGRVLRAGAHRDHGEPGVLPAGAVPPVADVRVGDPEHGARHHLRAGRGPPAGAGGPGPAARGGQGGGHGGE